MFLTALLCVLCCCGHILSHPHHPAGRDSSPAVIISSASGSSGSPSSSGHRHRHERHQRQVHEINNVLNYLTLFGYLPQSDVETGNLRSQEQIVDAIKTMQNFGNIPVTGEIDEMTQELMKRPRCGLPDIISDSFRSRRSLDDGSSPLNEREEERREGGGEGGGREGGSGLLVRRKRYSVQGQRWHYHNLTWSLRKGTRRVQDGHIRYQINRALNLWEEASTLKFTEVNSDDADIRISFNTGYHHDGYKFDGPGNLLAHAFFPGSGLGGDAHFDDDEDWVSDSGVHGKVSFYAVAAHEFGHSLGLSHSSVQGAIMFPYYQHLGDNYTLSSDDITGIQAIYGRKYSGGVENPALRPTRRPVNPVKPDLPTKSPKPTKKATYRPHRPETPETPETPVTPEPPVEDEKPNTCDTSYDAISMIRRELFIFKGKYFWRIGANGLQADYPVKIDRFWSRLPANLTHIDAFYEKTSSSREMVIFIGKQYWVYPNNEGGLGPFPLTRLGLPEDLEKIDGAMVWGHNGKTYFFSGTMYWRYDEEAQSVELDYPRDMSMWKGVPYNIDSVFQYKNGKTYFFKGKVFWEFNDRKMRVASTTPTVSSPFWMGCNIDLKPGEGRLHSAPSSAARSILDVVNVLFLTMLMATHVLFM